MRGLVDAPNPQTYNARPILGPIVGLKGAGWSSLVARRAHNPKVVGSNPAPATSTLNTNWGFAPFLFLEI